MIYGREHVMVPAHTVPLVHMSIHSVYKYIGVMVFITQRQPCYMYSWPEVWLASNKMKDPDLPHFHSAHRTVIRGSIRHISSHMQSGGAGV